MSLRASSRRLVLSASPALLPSTPSPAHHLQRLLLVQPSRTKWTLSKMNPFRRRSGEPPTAASAAAEQLDDPSIRRESAKLMAPKLDRSIFEDEVRPEGGSTAESAPQVKSTEAARWVTDPDPRADARWHRKQVINMVRRAGRLTRQERIARSERTFTLRSPVMRTSTKKLMHLAHQVAGKTVDDALVQMRFSKKKYGPEVGYHIAEARDRAVVARGMGLGRVAATTTDSNGKPTGKTPKARTILTKDGRRVDVRDPTSMYVAEAWVNRGPLMGWRPNYMARGRMSRMLHRTSSITLVLKEEKTRIREHDDRAAKAAKRKPWVHLPDRPVSAQRPYYSW